MICTAKPLDNITYSKSITISLSHACSNRCDYCSFWRDDANLISLSEVDFIIQRGKELGCKEVLVMSGENPGQFPEIQKALYDRGFHNYIHYVREICQRIIAQGILPHVNIGCITYQEMQVLKPETASMGLMLESSNPHLSVHRNSPSKHPDIRLKVIDNAGRLKIPFTTGILIGIGESWKDRKHALMAIAELQKQYGHIQEIIIQNFVPKQGTPLSTAPGASYSEVKDTVALARDLMPEMSIQIPPNLLPGKILPLLKAGANDLGGISVEGDHINPEMPWPKIQALADKLLANGYRLEHRLAVYPGYINKDWLSSQILQIAGRSMEDA